MVYSSEIGKWVQIYLAADDGAGGVKSQYNATILDTTDWMDFVDKGANVGMRLLDDAEFQAIAAGSNEETNVAGSADPVTAGGHSDTAARRMISNIGCEDCAGALWQWLKTPSARLDNGTAAGWYNLPGVKGSFYTYGTNLYGNTQLLAGGDWHNGADCGSRSRYAANYRWSTNTNVGGRFLAEPL
jgi:formylglycine-generating enzyme required for sulfatase activity